MRFIVDHQLPPELVRWLVERGHQADHVFSLGLGNANDAEIWEWTLKQSATVLTKDGDFARRRHASNDGPTIVWLRIGNASTPELLRWLESRWSKIESQSKKRRGVIEVR